MCYAPITIKNNSKLYRPLTSKDLVKVPCGKCRECQIAKENDWFVRIYYEYKRTIAQGGKVFFVSMGYNDAHLPILDTMSQEFSSLVPLLNDFFSNTEKYRLNEVDYQDLQARVDRYRSRYDVVSLDIPQFRHACFNDEHITHFFKSLRQYLNSDGKLKYEDAPLKYFLCSEYGDEKHRPHYHVLIFLPIPLDTDYFLRICRKSWSYRVKRSLCPDYVLAQLDNCMKYGIKYCNFSTPNGRNWRDWHIQYQPTSKRYIVKRQYGFVNYSIDKESGRLRPVIEDIRGCKYLTRYLNYYDNYLKDKGFEMLKDWIKLFPNFCDIVGYKPYRDKLHKLKLVFPIRRVSQNFGSLFYDELSCQSHEELVETLKRNEVIIPNEQKPYPIPTYIINRLCYKLDDVRGLPNKVSFLTPIGYQVFIDSLEDKLFARRQMYTETLKVLRSFLTKVDIDNFKDSFGFDISIINTPAIGFNLRNLSLFDVVLNGVSVNHITQAIWLKDLTSAQILDNVYDIYLNQLALRTDFLKVPEVLFDDLYFLRVHNKSYLKRRCYNCLPQFDYYDKVLTVIHYIRRVVLERDAKEKTVCYKDSTLVREALNNFHYRET